MATGIPTAKLFYREAMEQVHSYNSKLLLDRRLRMPYIDNQTGLAQQDCHLWVSRVQRCSPLREGQVYSYPSRRWMVRKRPDFVGSSKLVERKPPLESEEPQPEAPTEEKTTNENIKSEESVPNVEPATSLPAAIYEDYYDDEAFDSEFDSDEEFGTRKKKRKTASRSRTKKYNNGIKPSEKSRMGSKDDVYRPNAEERKRSYDCQICNKRYKNHQSLRYHYEHHNHGLPETQLSVNSMQDENSNSSTVDQPPADHVAGAKRKKGMPPSSYCDFCLGSLEVNKKSGASEELISCADCGRSGHPSCLQFNEKLTEQVKKYKWQCIECKCCCMCGTSDNDEQLLFCDDCDRGYHMYCLNPPIAEPPEGSWQCQLCEARVKGFDITKVPVLPQHMDVVVPLPSVRLSQPSPSQPIQVPKDTKNTEHVDGNTVTDYDQNSQEIHSNQLLQPGLPPDSVQPSSPFQPFQHSQPTQPKHPTQLAQVNQPNQPSSPTLSTESNQPTQSIQPPPSVQPTQTTARSPPSQQPQPISQPSDPSQQSQPPQITEQSTLSSQPNESIQQTESIHHSQPQSIRPVKTIHSNHETFPMPPNHVTSSLQQPNRAASLIMSNRAPSSVQPNHLNESMQTNQAFHHTPSVPLNPGNQHTHSVESNGITPPALMSQSSFNSNQQNHIFQPNQSPHSAINLIQSKQPIPPNQPTQVIQPTQLSKSNQPTLPTHPSQPNQTGLHI